MTAEFKPGVRYRMPAVFGPAPGPRQKADGTPWKPEETGTMNCQWMTVSYRTHREKLEKLLPPGFALRGEPIVSVSYSFFKNLYWLLAEATAFSSEIPVGTPEKRTISGCSAGTLGRPSGCNPHRSRRTGLSQIVRGHTDINLGSEGHRRR
jgi:hypothetical protein